MNWINTYMKIAKEYATHSKCAAKHVACVLVKDNNIISVGINGTRPGAINCCDLFYKNKETGMWFKRNQETYNLEDCEQDAHHKWSLLHETHAEINALAKANKNGVSVEGATAFITHSPCNNCAKTLATFGVKRIIFDEKYDDIEEVSEYLKEIGVQVYKWSEFLDEEEYNDESNCI